MFLGSAKFAIVLSSSCRVPCSEIKCLKMLLEKLGFAEYDFVLNFLLTED